MSLVYKKDFYEFVRKGYKIQDLCKMAGLSNRVVDNGEWMPMRSIDYTQVDVELQPWISKSQMWIKTAIES